MYGDIGSETSTLWKLSDYISLTNTCVKLRID